MSEIWKFWNGSVLEFCPLPGIGPAPGLNPVATDGLTTASGATHCDAAAGTGPVPVEVTVAVWLIVHWAPQYQTREFPCSVFEVGHAPTPIGESVSRRRSWNDTFRSPRL